MGPVTVAGVRGTFEQADRQPGTRFAVGRDRDRLVAAKQVKQWTR